MRVAARVRVRVCECVCQERRLACESFFPVEQRDGTSSSASRANNRVLGERIPALRLHEEDPGTL